MLVWDRPNCGASDIQLFGETESQMRASTLAGMVDALELGPLHVMGSSGGARDSIVFTIEYPHLVKSLAVWSLAGGTYSTMTQAIGFALNDIRTVREMGMDGILSMAGPVSSWAELLDANVRNKERLQAIGSDRFERVLRRWFDAYVPKANEAIPGIPDWQFAGIKVPTLVIGNGRGDIDHPIRTSYVVHCLIRGSRLVEPPYPMDTGEARRGTRVLGDGNVTDPQIEAVPLLLDFIIAAGDVAAGQ
ncbi:hydrolase [Rhodococcus ruber BKS 20-38]|uniref:Hydrolase n=1 Tax=Rhodococcus ruber BKS 20-38 TaxID=1278076 RepID=M2YZ35_9NOCA|nr:hydrolase [Rhodococcus ruber BKS 20-38]